MKLAPIVIFAYNRPDKILRTNLTETDYSKTVTAELLTADLGEYIYFLT